MVFRTHYGDAFAEFHGLTKDSELRRAIADKALDAGFRHPQDDDIANLAMRLVQPELDRMEDENSRLRKVIAHLMTNPLNALEHRCHTSDIDDQTGHVEITDEPGDRTTIRIADPVHDLNAAMTRDLGQVLDVEAGLAEVLSTSPADPDRTTEQ